jgi:hypothetical protein
VNAYAKQSLSTLPNTSSSVVSYRNSNQRILLTEFQSEWYSEVVSRLNQLMNLPKGWDGYRAGPASLANVLFAVELLQRICSPSAPVPSVVPGQHGDVQLEWHLHAGDIELHVRAPYDVYAWRLTAETGEDGEELDLTNDFTEVGKWFSQLLENNSASKRASA